MKRILILCPNISGLGGVEKVVINLANELATCNEVIIGTLTYPRPSYHLDSSIKCISFSECRYRKYKIISHLARKLIKHGIVHASKDTTEKLFYPNYRIREFAKKINEYEVNSIIGVGIDMTIIASYIKQEHKTIRVIGWQHNEFRLYFETPGEYYFGLLAVFNDRAKFIDENIVLTNNEKSNFEKKSEIVSKRIYNPLCIFGEDFFKSDTFKQKNIIFVGRIVKEQKGIDFLIKILVKFFNYKLKGWSASIVGDGPDMDYLKQEIAENHLVNKVKICGGVKDVSDYYRASSILLSTSRWEGFGLVITEALYYGLNVIAFENEGPSEIIQDSINGFLVPKYDIDNFVNKMVRIVKDDELRRFISNNARASSSNYLPNIIYSEWNKIV